MAQSPEDNATSTEIIRYDLGWNAINAMLRAGRSLSGHERNCCFLNLGSGRYADISGAAGLDFPDDGRVLATTDWDLDGDIDLWIANRSGPQVRYMQNNIGDGEKANFVAIRLEGVDCNRDAIGARVTVVTGPHTQLQCLRAGEGYLAQSSKWLHFGLGNNRQIDRAIIQWPDGSQQIVEELTANQRYKIRQHEPAQVWNAQPPLPELARQDWQAPSVSDQARILLLRPVSLPEITCPAPTGETISLTDGSRGAVLINLWASWCQPCLKELSEWKAHADGFTAANLEIIALNVDTASEQESTVPALVKRLELPFTMGVGTEELASLFDTIQRSLLSRQRPLPVPSSFLIDSQGRLRAVYKGPISADQILRDVQLLDADADQLLAAAIPFQGRWLEKPAGSTPLQLAVKLIESDYSDLAETYIGNLMDREGSELSASLLNLRAAILTDAQRYQEAAQIYAESLKRDPNNRQANIELGSLLLGIRQGHLAEPHFRRALAGSPNDPELLTKLGIAYLQQGKLKQAQGELRRALSYRSLPMAHWYLADIAIASKNVGTAISEYEAAIKLNPQLTANANNLAWLLATSTSPEQRNGRRAVEIAQAICEQMESPTAQALDTLAAAYAENSQFAEAEAAAAKAIATTDNPDFADSIRQRKQLYQQQKPYREKL